MGEYKVIKILKNDLNFSESSINKLKIFHDCLLEQNKSYVFKLTKVHLNQ